MGNVTLPTPVFVAGGALCLLAGYLAGSVIGPNAPAGSTATVASYDAGDSQLCLEGKSVEKQKGLDDRGQLCGVWSHSRGARAPHKGQKFRFVAIQHPKKQGEQAGAVVIFGTVSE